MNTAIFLKCYAKDFEWVKYCLRSIVRFSTGFAETVVVSDAGEPLPPIGAIEKHYLCNLKTPGYCWQQVLKVNADAFTECSHVLFADADTIFTRPIKPEDVTENGKPIWLYEPYNGMTNPDVLSRQKMVSEFVGQPVEFEFMRRHPFIITRELLADLRRFCWRTHGMSMDDWMMSKQDGLSEFNLAGSWLYHYRRSEIAWKHPSEVPVFVDQRWSHGGLDEQTKKQWEELLK